MRDGEPETESEVRVRVEWKDLAEFCRVVVNDASRGALHGSNLSLATVRRLLQDELQHALPDKAISETISVDRHLARQVAVSGSTSGPVPKKLSAILLMAITGLAGRSVGALEERRTSEKPPTGA